MNAFSPKIPAQPLKQGENMPNVSDSSWGDTLWYWAGEEQQE